jgi:hypothetical protein
MHVYRNDAPGQNTAPTAPVGMSATVQPNGSVHLTWASANDDHTPSAALTYDLEVFRDGAPVTLPKRLPEPGNVSNVNQWLLNALPNGYYEWTLQAVDASYTGGPVASGTFNIGVTGIDSPAIPFSFRLEQNFPNPFNPTTTIHYQMPEPGEVRLTVYNSLGQQVRTLVNTYQPAGRYAIQWDGRNQSGLQVASGTYFYEISTGTFSAIRKMMLLK